MKERFLCFVRNALAVALLALPTISHADDILTISVDGISESLSFDDLLAMPQSKVVTKTIM